MENKYDLPQLSEMSEDILPIVHEYIDQHISMEYQQPFAAILEKVHSTLPVACNIFRGFCNYNALQDVDVVLTNFDEIPERKHTHKIPAEIVSKSNTMDEMIEWACLGMAAQISAELQDMKYKHGSAEFRIKNLATSVTTFAEKTLGVQIEIKSQYEIVEVKL